MPNLRKRKSEQLLAQCQDERNTTSCSNKQKALRASNRKKATKENVPNSDITTMTGLSTARYNTRSKARLKEDASESADRVPSTNINALADEILIQMFLLLDTKTIVKAVGRTCTRWNRLSKDRLLWREVDLRFGRLNAATVQTVFCLLDEPGRLRSLYMTAESERFDDTWSYDIDCRPDWEPRCLTLATMRKIKELGSGLRKYGIEYEQIYRLNLLSYLPSYQLTHLSLAHCEIHFDDFKQLILPGSRSQLKELLVLDLTGAIVRNIHDMVHYHWRFPPKLHTLILRQSEISLAFEDFQELILDQSNLIELDISIMLITNDFLADIPRHLCRLQYLNLSGSVVGHDTTDTYKTPNGSDENRSMYRHWDDIWSESSFDYTLHDHGEPFSDCLKSVNLRNVTHPGGYLMKNPKHITVSYIDVDGKERIASNQDPDLVSEIGRKWENWKSSPLERTKHSYAARYAKKKKIDASIREAWSEYAALAVSSCNNASIVADDNDGDNDEDDGDDDDDDEHDDEYNDYDSDDDEDDDIDSGDDDDDDGGGSFDDYA